VKREMGEKELDMGGEGEWKERELKREIVKCNKNNKMRLNSVYWY
jgi:hypothetical protein